jgi:hypothetical protein
MDIHGQELPAAVGCAIVGAFFVQATLGLCIDLGRLSDRLPGAVRILVRILVRDKPASSPKIVRRRVVFALVWITLMQVIPVGGFVGGGRFGMVVQAECGLFILAELVWVGYVRTHLLTSPPAR